MKRVTAGGVVFEPHGFPNYVYIAKPSNNFGPWTFPKGGVEQGESLEEAALREVEEEIGVPARLPEALGILSEAGNLRDVEVFRRLVIFLGL